MKQLLQTLDSKIIAGLSDRAYLVVGENSTSRTPFVYELLPPAGIEIGSSEEKSSNGKEHVPSGNEVQAVDIAQYGIDIWCAVSRHDKSLSLYCFRPQELLATQKGIAPTTVHKTTKRATCITFASILSCSDNKNDESTLNVLVAGDLTGDANAFPLRTIVAPESSASNGSSEKEETKPVSRLLLGHTASMLTGVRVLTDNGTTRILTSDRDEKVRVSQFPNACVVEGYLLGHTAFISAMDVATDDGCTRCVTCGGDGTVRLWDYASIKELSVANVVVPDQDGKEELQEEKESKLSTLIPSSVAMSADGCTVAVIFDACQIVQIFVASGPDHKELKLHQTIDCMSSSLLAVRFSDNENMLVLTREPKYILAFSCAGEKQGIFSLANKEGCNALRLVAESDAVSMPTTILEKDQTSGKLTIFKRNENRSGNKPWNDSGRLEIAKQRDVRRKKRKKEARQGEDCGQVSE